jgi:hypothetical protein
MKLHEVPRNSRIRVISNTKVPPGAPEIKVEQELNFSHIDGMYSYCTTDAGQVVHIAAWSEVEIINK